MPEKRYKVGDTVTLKSGGHVMTVITIGSDVEEMLNKLSDYPERKTVQCEWFEKSRHKSNWFDPETLKPARANR